MSKTQEGWAALMLFTINVSLTSHSQNKYSIVRVKKQAKCIEMEFISSPTHPKSRESITEKMERKQKYARVVKQKEPCLSGLRYLFAKEAGASKPLGGSNPPGSALPARPKLLSEGGNQSGKANCQRTCQKCRLKLYEGQKRAFLECIEKIKII